MPKVLVVDDSSVDRSRAAGLLRKSQDIQVEFATNGCEALQYIAQSPPDLVLTDLVMPEMDGLELVAQIVSQHPLVPVILMTGRGSEQTAVRALQTGAASYVPKRLLAALLMDTVAHVLDASQEARSEFRLMDCLTHSEAHFRLKNDASMIGPLVNYLHRTIRLVGSCDADCGIRVCVALEEAINNALFHGNLEINSSLRTGDCDLYRQTVAQRLHTAPFCDRVIDVRARFTREDATFVVRDQGPGFDPRSLPDPTDPENLEKASGRGLLLMRTFMDSVEYNSRGNEVTMVKCHRHLRKA
jgi:CheY-like chemotaxis protein